jgi:hypothetical protein
VPPSQVSPASGTWASHRAWRNTWLPRRCPPPKHLRSLTASLPPHPRPRAGAPRRLHPLAAGCDFPSCRRRRRDPSPPPRAGVGGGRTCGCRRVPGGNGGDLGGGWSAVGGNWSGGSPRREGEWRERASEVEC